MHFFAGKFFAFFAENMIYYYKSVYFEVVLCIKCEGALR